MINLIPRRSKIIYKLAKSRERRTRDLTDIAFVKDRDGKILTDGESIRTRCKGYFHLLFNVENDREELQEVQPTEGPLPLYSVEEVSKQLEKMGIIPIYKGKGSILECKITEVLH